MTPSEIERITTETTVRQVIYVSEVDSTNNLARQRADDGVPLPLLVIADRQTAGRGRGNNRWWTGDGALAFSLVLELPVVRRQPARAPLVGIAGALAVARAVAPLVPQGRLGIRWPNDVFLDGRKLAGVLVEGLAEARFVVGIGVNTNNDSADAPPPIKSRVASLRSSTGRLHDQTALLISTLQHLASLATLIETTPEAVAAEADARCLQKGETLTVELGGRLIVGRCEGLAADGALRLATASGARELHSGRIVQPLP